MKICLFPNLAYLSETSRAIEVYNELIKKGQKPIFATHGGTYESILRDENIPYHIVPPLMTKNQCQDYVAANVGDKRNFYNVSTLRERVQNEIDFFSSHEVGLVHIGFTLSAKLSARYLNIPLSTAHGSFFPPVFENRIAMYNKKYDYGIYRIVPKSWKKSIVNWLYVNTKHYNKPFNKVAKELNIEPINSLVELFTGDYTLVTDAPEIIGLSKEEIESWKKSSNSLYNCCKKLFHVGAIYAKLFGDLPQEVSDFLDTDKPKIFVALTSSTGKYLDKAYDSLKDLDCKVVLCTTVHPANYKPKKNMMIKEHLPSHKVMPLCDVAIIHGGQGSVQTAIASNTPIIGFSLQPEQNLNLQLVEKHKAGLNLPLQVLGNGGLGDYVNMVVRDKNYQSKMSRLKSWQDNYNGAKRAAEVLINLTE